MRKKESKFDIEREGMRQVRKEEDRKRMRVLRNMRKRVDETWKERG